MGEGQDRMGQGRAGQGRAGVGCVGIRIPDSVGVTTKCQSFVSIIKPK